MFLFQIIDEGLIKRVEARNDLEALKNLVSGEIKEYLDENGFEGTTEDGYAKIIEVDPSGLEEERHLWSYSFDGEESIEEAVQRIEVPSFRELSGSEMLNINGGVPINPSNESTQSVSLSYCVYGRVDLNVPLDVDAKDAFWESHDGKLINELEGHCGNEIFDISVSNK
jgi:hypothetical protein